MSKLSKRKGALKFGTIYAITRYRHFCNLEYLNFETRDKIFKALDKLNIEDLETLYAAMKNPSFYTYMEEPKKGDKF